jgi:hypothetical protein
MPIDSPVGADAVVGFLYISHTRSGYPVAIEAGGCDGEQALSVLPAMVRTLCPPGKAAVDLRSDVLPAEAQAPAGSEVASPQSEMVQRLAGQAP